VSERRVHRPGAVRASVGQRCCHDRGDSRVLKQRGIDPAELSTFFGQTHAEGWGEARGDLNKVAHYVALNMASFGFSTETTDEDGRVTVMASWSDEHPDRSIPLRPALTEDLTASFEPIISWLGVTYSWEATDDALVLHLAD
jgi:hypothetical protein